MGAWGVWGVWGGVGVWGVWGGISRSAYRRPPRRGRAVAVPGRTRPRRPRRRRPRCLRRRRPLPRTPSRSGPTR
ncbi:hypothetical protein CP974_24575 [Streptomyces fradiae ATCC 10745 = DSM 40063]|nr:hypothetical protein CP974_24575 [Streptomyces fradiae ATCC 10745 = DSM 40063]